MAPAENHTTAELSHLELQRQVLERLVRVARSLETLKHGLESVLDQGHADQPLRPELEATFHTLGGKIRNMSDAEVLLRLKKLDRALAVSFHRIQPWIEAENAEPDSAEDLSDAIELIAGFRRYAQTGLALRVLMRRRGVAVPDLVLPLERERLTQQLATLRAREGEARNEVVGQLQAMAREMDRLLAVEASGEAMRQMLEAVRQDLVANIQHIKAGKPMHELPVPIEDVVLETPAAQKADAAPDIPKATAERPAKEVSGKVVPENLVSEKVKSGPAAEAPSATDGEPSGPRRHNLLSDFLVWLKSPWGVRWRDIRRR